jgi:hypothetical protein
LISNICDGCSLRNFCVGISTAFGIVRNLDRLMVATKEVVGEQFHIQGVGASLRGRTRTIDSLKHNEV